MVQLSVLVSENSTDLATQIGENLQERGLISEYYVRVISHDEFQKLRSARFEELVQRIDENKTDLIVMVDNFCDVESALTIVRQIIEGKDVVIAYVKLGKLATVIGKLLMGYVKRQILPVAIAFRRGITLDGSSISKDKVRFYEIRKGIFKEILTFLALIEYRPIKFALVGASGILVNEGLLWLLVTLFLPIYLASAIAIESSILGNFTLNDIWTFKFKKTGKWYVRCLKYHLSVAVGGFVNYGTLLALVTFGLNYLIANLFGIFLGFIANYILSERVVWSKKLGD